MCVCVCVCFIRGQVHVSLCVHTCGSQRMTLDVVFSSDTVHLSFEDRVCRWDLWLPDQARLTDQ